MGWVRPCEASTVPNSEQNGLELFVIPSDLEGEEPGMWKQLQEQQSVLRNELSKFVQTQQQLFDSYKTRKAGSDVELPQSPAIEVHQTDSQAAQSQPYDVDAPPGAPPTTNGVVAPGDVKQPPQPASGSGSQVDAPKGTKNGRTDELLDADPGQLKQMLSLGDLADNKALSEAALEYADDARAAKVAKTDTQ